MEQITKSVVSALYDVAVAMAHNDAENATAAINECLLLLEIATDNAVVTNQPTAQMEEYITMMNQLKKTVSCQKQSMPQ